MREHLMEIEMKESPDTFPHLTLEKKNEKL